MADTTIIRNNASVDLPSRAPAPQSSHTLVSVDTLTNSPSSSTGSASVLDWNSNSDGEVLEWPFSAPPTPPTLTAPSSPPISTSSNTFKAPVESNGGHLVQSRSSFDAPEQENTPEPHNSALPADLSRTLCDQFQLFNLIDDMQYTMFSDPTSPAGSAPPQFPHFNFIGDLQNKNLSDRPSPTGATPSRDVANVAEHVTHGDDIYGSPKAEGVLHPQPPSEFPNTPSTSLSGTSNRTILAPGDDSDATSMTTVTPVESPAVASSLFLPPQMKASNSNSVEEANTQGIRRPQVMPFITPNPSPTPSFGQRSYATSEASTESANRIEYQSASSRSVSPRPNDFYPTWNNGFGHDSGLESRESLPSIQHSPSSFYVGGVSISPGLFGPFSPSSRTTSPVPEFSVSEERTTCGLHSNGTASLPTPNNGFSGYSQSLSTSSIEIGRREDPHIDIPSWLRAAPCPTISKVETTTAIQDSDSVRLQHPYSNSFPNVPNVPVPPVQPARTASTNRRCEAGPRLRPPLPAIPLHAQVTPQFALRSHSPNSDVDTNNYFAEAIPSRWSGRTPVSPRLPPISSVSSSISDSPWPVTQPLSPGPYPTHFQSWQRNPPTGWGPPNPRPPCQNAFGGNTFPTRGLTMAPSTWGSFGSNNRAQTAGSVLNTGYPPIPGPAPLCPNPWGTSAQRRLRFAPLPATPGSNLNNAPRSQPLPPTLPLPQVPPPRYNFQSSLPQQQQPVPYGSRPGYLYSTPAPVIPLPTSQTDLYTPSTRFWFTDGTVIFRVENTLHKVHRHFFEYHSEHFKKLLSTYWFSPTSHLFLAEIKKTEFEMLLSIFYPTDLIKPDITTVEGWSSILALSYKYIMPQLESLSIQKLHALTTPVEKIAIAKKFDFGKKHHQTWLIPAYVDLCSRDAPLSLEEAEQLDMPTVVMVWNVRHAVKVVMSRGRRGVVLQDELLLRLVKESWGLGQEDEEEYDDDAMPWSDFQYACP